MHFNRLDPLSVFQWSSLALVRVCVCVCVFRACFAVGGCWSMVCDPVFLSLQRFELRVLCECFVSASAIASAIAKRMRMRILTYPNYPILILMRMKTYAILTYPNLS